MLKLGRRTVASVKRKCEWRGSAEQLEIRALMSIAPNNDQPASENQPVTIELVSHYGTALFGNGWEDKAGMDSVEIKTVIDDGQWRALLNGDQNQFVVDFRAQAQGAGKGVTQAWFDAKLEAADLPTLRIAQYDWFEEPNGHQAEPQVGLEMDGMPNAMPMSAPLNGNLRVTSSTFLSGVDSHARFDILRDASEGTACTTDYHTEDLTAHAGTDYTSTTGTLFWGEHSEGTTQLVYVPLLSPSYGGGSLISWANSPDTKEFRLVLDNVTAVPTTPDDSSEGIPEGGAGIAIIKYSHTPNPYPTPPEPPPKPPAPPTPPGCATTPAVAPPVIGNDYGPDKSGFTQVLTAAGNWIYVPETSISSQTGNVTISPPAWNTEGYAVTYSSDVNPHPIVAVNANVPQPTPGKHLYTASATLEFLDLGTGSVVLTGPTLYYSDAIGLNAADGVRFVMQADATSLATGTYACGLLLKN